MKSKIYYLFLLLAVVIFALSGCKAENEKTESVYSNDDFPSFVVESTSVLAGEKDAVVNVKLKDNPGFLTMAVNIEYDQSVMVLTDVINGKDYAEYNFIPPKNKRIGCTASWFIPDLPKNIVDGKLLELHFSVSNDAKSGDYTIKISRPDNGGIVDGSKETLVINNAVGYLTVK